MAKGNKADSQVTVCRRNLDPDRKAVRDLLKGSYTTSRMAANTTCPCGKSLLDCSKAVVIHA